MSLLDIFIHVSFEFCLLILNNNLKKMFDFRVFKRMERKLYEW